MQTQQASNANEDQAFSNRKSAANRPDIHITLPLELEEVKLKTTRNVGTGGTDLKRKEKVGKEEFGVERRSLEWWELRKKQLWSVSHS